MRAPVLSQATLDDLPADVPRPGYDRDAVTIGIVHLGVGGFHRAHQAMYVDRLLAAGHGQEWGISGIGVLPGDARMAAVMSAQDCLYTLVEKNSDGGLAPRVIGSIVSYLHAPAGPEAVIEQLAAPATRIVSMTITEGGYAIDAVTHEFDPGQGDIELDLRREGPPRTAFGLVTEALRRRRDRDLPAFTIMSCDNIAGNGHVAQRVFTAYARLDDPELASWIADQVRFPNSMVDRITPVTTDADREMVLDQLGIADAWPVVCEPFAQWVLEDVFSAGRPRLEDVGVQIVDDVEPYELMKLRLLNAGHQALGYLGNLAGYRLVHEVAQDPLFAQLVLAYMDREATPTLAPVPGIDLAGYKQQLLQRFSNAHVRDTVARLCVDSSDRMPKWVLPVIRAQLATGGGIELATTVVAAWACFVEGTDERGEPIQVVDRQAATLRELARQGGTAFIENRTLFGDLADDARFGSAYEQARDSLHAVGARATVQRLVDSLT